VGITTTLSTYTWDIFDHRNANMAFFSMAMPWNEGEEKMHKLFQVTGLDNPTATMLTPQGAYLLQRAPLLALGTLDAQNRPWTTLWGGEPGFSEPLGGGVVGTRAIVDGSNDPVVEALVGGSPKGEAVQGNQKMVSGLTIDLVTRKRVKIFGRMVAGALGDVEAEGAGGAEHADGPAIKQDQIQLATKIEQSMGNCPKYLNQYEIQPSPVRSKLIAKGSSLSPDAKDLISKADMFFLSSSTAEDMDTNHRGGPPGFVRILSDTEIVYPEYSGNRLYQTLGNLQLNPKVGIVFPDYGTGNVVYLTGTAEILVREEAAALLPGSNLALKIRIDEVRSVESGLPFRGVKKTPSPYNPLVRTLASEGNIKAAYSGTRKMATLVKKTKIAPRLARFTFSVPEGLVYKPGQWVALDFSKELDFGYSHMRDDDPTSLNDDFVRTFTISSSPSSESSLEKTFDMTIRNVGVVTDFLFDQAENSGLQVPVLGVGGDFQIQLKEGKHVGFVAGGVGITPLLGQLPYLGSNLATLMRLFWTLRADDIDLVVDTLDQYPQLFSVTTIYLTGYQGSDSLTTSIKNLEDSGVRVISRRMTMDDLAGQSSDTWYLCAAKPLRKGVLQWLEGKRVVFEDFDY
jgi:ferredoxin-NADP reductase/predicted pyridoxine 5'-phosphate oxidase superfamily flavin-nucleotide-binding protein